jgi:gas vesicle protein GvpL/GvpF
MRHPQTTGRHEAAVSTGGKYIYAIVAARGGRSLGFLGLNDQPIEAIACDGFASVVSDLAVEKIRPERRYLAAHRAVLGKLVEQEDAVLPMRFGTIASGPAEIVRMMSRNRKRFARQLRRVAGKVEMGLRVTWDVPNIFEYLVRIHSELRQLRDNMFQRAVAPSQEDRIELGRTFERLLNEDRLEHTKAVEEALTSCCAEINRNVPRNEKEIMNLACLIDKDRRADFESSVFEAAQRFDNNFAFDYNGPWAPHGFVEIDIRG